MNLRKLLQAFGLPALLLFLSLLTYAQTKLVTGRVTDAQGKGIGGVSVVVKGQSTGTTTNETGSYSLTVPQNATTLVFSSVGYTSREVTVTGNSADVNLESASGTLNDLVVIAYGSRRKTDLTGSVTSVTAKDFQKGVINSSEQLLQGKVAGLQITTGGGAAGTGSRIRIRGGASLNATNEPLLVIDGVPIEVPVANNGLAGSANLLNTINPNDIESITVLKDASATALYGSRASNGVLIVTTKKGTRGKLRFNFNTQFSVGEVANKVDVLTGDEVRNIITQDAAATGNNTYKNLLGTANTDWQDQIFQKAFGNENNISASGSLANMPFRMSLGYLTQDGTLKTNHFNRLSSALNLSPKFFNDHLAVNLNVKASHTANQFANEGAIGSAVAFDPTQPVYSNKRFGYFEWLQADGNPIDLSTRNPLALLYQRHNTSDVNRI
ncbi:MAG TPA: TonB-dependent receptor plug domain-containing protein, partial [Flavisolibacter sp.]|nr:TonB-dependent receptor plug domain-containing protein [Flavisolibacter sp.]